ncbi:hypothetical protein [Halarcobacter sp.]|uniref:hypothetical protein n=1 Tax=Halarcobacter sp. TaxID=2321133 RepID=UPI002AAB0C01|nr:hypothetical protein [Halarcobacter sp.]
MDYKIIRNSILFIATSLFLVSCSAKNDSIGLGSKAIKIGNKANPVVLELNKPILKWHSYSCTDNSYTISDKNIEYGNLFIESINLDSNCHWSGLPLSHFESSVKSQLKFDEMETVEKIEIDAYVFKTYKVNENKYFSIIYIYNASDKSKFILDYNGLLYTKLIQSFDKNYKNKFLSEPRYSGNYNDSLARKNIVHKYFYAELPFQK